MHPRVEKIIDGFAELTGLRAIPTPLSRPSDPSCDILDVPGYVQTDTYGCGAIAGYTILKTFQKNPSFDRFYKLVNPNPDVGTTEKMLFKALKKSGIGAQERRDLNWTKIKKTIRDGYPIATIIRTGNPDIQHWIVIYGVGEKPNRVFVTNKGVLGLGKNPIEWKEFSRLWSGELRGYGMICWGIE